MKVKSKRFTQIDRKYIFSSREIKRALDIEGEIITMDIHSGRSPNDIEAGKSPDKDLWYINTKSTNEVKK